MAMQRRKAVRTLPSERLSRQGACRDRAAARPRGFGMRLAGSTTRSQRLDRTLRRRNAMPLGPVDHISATALP
ncbi:MAG TPA: hypothetical protein VM528_08755, partial [Burkholderiaceae bacterium]|nr:hypothetical protein [Burkholderiaceae bacterium]